jgi:hypothetical protein
LKQALDALEADRPGDALPLLREQIARDPSNPLLLAMLGVAQTRTGDPDAAVEALDRAHYLEPDNAQILVDYGNALLAAGRDQQARSRFEAALRLDPAHQGALRSLAELYQRLAGGAPAARRPAPGPAAPSAHPAMSEGLGPSSVAPARSLSPAAPAPDRPPAGAGSAAVERRARPPIDFTNSADTPDPSRWDPEPLPSFASLARATLQLWGQQPLIWLLVLAIPNALAVLVMPSSPALRWVSALLWTAALGIGAGPALMLMSNQWIFGRFQVGSGLRLRGALLHGTVNALFYALLVLSPFCVALTLRSQLPTPVILLAVLLSTAPFHALLGPALVLSATDGPPGWPALQRAWLLAGKRSWLHLALLVGVGGVMGGALGIIAWAFAVTLRAQGDAVLRVLEVAGLSLGETLWIALVTVAGLDAISAAEVEAEAPPRS